MLPVKETMKCMIFIITYLTEKVPILILLKTDKKQSPEKFVKLVLFSEVTLISGDTLEDNGVLSICISDKNYLFHSFSHGIHPGMQRSYIFNC